MIKYEIMAAVIQKAVEKALCEIKKPWEDKDIEFKGTKVKKIPKEMKYTIEALKLTEELVKPDFSVINEKIEPNKLSLFLESTFLDGVQVKMEFYPRHWTNGYGFDLSLYFELEQGKFKNVAKGALKHTYPISLSADSIYEYLELKGCIRDLKNELLVASRLRKNYSPNDNLPSGPGTS